MTVVDQTQFKLAVGWNNAAGFITLITTTPSGAFDAFPPMTALPTYQEGQPRTRMDGQFAMRGYQVVQWLTDGDSGLEIEHDYYLSNTFCSNGRSGLVTARTQTRQRGMFANYNAVLRLPIRNSLSYGSDELLEGYFLTLILIEAL